MRIINYFTNLAFLLAAAFLAVVSQAFTSSLAGWVAFGVSAGVALVALALAMTTRQIAAKTGQAAVVVMALWSVVAALSFTGPALTWLVFADAVGIIALALVNLGVHELSTEQVVHQMEVLPQRDVDLKDERQYTAA